MEFRLLTKDDKSIINDVMNDYLLWGKNIKFPLYPYETLENNVNFVNNNFFNDVNDDIILSAGIESNVIKWLAVTVKLKYWTKNTDLSKCWYWKFLYSRNKAFKNTGPIVDKLAQPVLEYYEKQKFWKFFKVTKLSKKLLLNNNTFIESKHNKIFNFETYDLKIELICNDPKEKTNDFFYKFLPITWKSGTPLVVMSHTKKNV